MKNVRLIFAAVLLSTALLIAAGWPQSASAADVNFTNLWVGNVSPGSGHIGVDMWWPNGGSSYLPCHNSNDIYYGACILSNADTVSYYKVMHYAPSGTDFPFGVFVDNQNSNHCTSASWCKNKSATTINHGWARLISDISLEIYPYDSDGQYNPSGNTIGGLRIEANSFPNFSNGGRYSNNVGDISLPQLGQTNVGKLNGFVTENGVKVGKNRVSFDVFQRDRTRTSSTGYPLAGFTLVKNNSDGYYNTGPVPSGSYRIYITDTQTNHKIILDGVNIFHSHERLDFKLEQRCFGYPNLNCTDPA